MKNTVEKKQSSGSIDYVLTSQTYLKQADFIYNIKDILFMIDKNIQLAVMDNDIATLNWHKRVLKKFEKVLKSIEPEEYKLNWKR